MRRWRHEIILVAAQPVEAEVAGWLAAADVFVLIHKRVTGPAEGVGYL